jgi:hypothetical protein
MAKPSALILIAALLAAVTGCGSSDDSGSDVRSDVEAAVRRALTQDDPAFCTTGATARFLNQLYRDFDNPVEQCRFEAALPGEPSARRLSFQSVAVDGDHAVTTVAVTGGSNDGSVVRIGLVKDGSRWKFDRLADIRIDRARFDAASRRDLEAYGISSEEADCAVMRVRRFYDTDQLERATLRGESEGFAAAEAVCLGRSSLIKLFDLGFRKAAPRDLPEPLVDCVSRKLTQGASTPLLRALFAAPDELDSFTERAVTAAVKSCAKEAEAGLIPQPSTS